MVTITIGKRKDVARQWTQPSGWAGRLTVRMMNRRHSKLTDWALQYVPVRQTDIVLDIGCGGGRTVAKLAAIAGAGRVTGIDHSEASVTVSRKTTAKSRNVEILRASVSNVPFPDSTFDVVTAVETHYYWPDLGGNLREVLRVLRPGGTFAIIAEAYKGAKYGRMMQEFERLAEITLLTPDEHRHALVSAGFSDVQVQEAADKGWICVTGRKA
jgi:ubiquinone/menaquinone biosynthesis C-methylase UbiE